MGKEFDCRDCERQIPDFLKQKMNYRVLKRFCAHVGACKDCHEELTIQFLVTEGMSRLEEGDAFDLNRELDKRMGEAGRKLSKTERFINAGAVLEVLVMLGILCVTFWIVLR